MRTEQGRHTGVEWVNFTFPVPYTSSDVWVAAAGSVGPSCILGMRIGDPWWWIWASRIRTKPALGGGQGDKPKMNLISWDFFSDALLWTLSYGSFLHIKSCLALLSFQFSFLFSEINAAHCVDPAGHGAQEGGHGLRLSFDLDLIPNFNFVTRMEIKY